MDSLTKEIIEKTERFGANNYHPLPIVISKANGVWVEDVAGKKYMDMLSSYSALNQGHRHPKIINALIEQAQKVTLTSRAFHNERLCEFYEKVSALTNKPMVLPMNTGAEAVETAVKAMRRWGYRKKGVEKDKAEIIVCDGNFHGRTVTVTSFSSNEEYKSDFGPFTTGFKIIPYGDSNALKEAINENTVGFLFEPIQGEAGVIIPKEGYIREIAKICKDANILLVADEIQTGFGRTGKNFACDWENVIPDIYIMGKALGGGVLPISAIAAEKEVLDVFEPGSHGSTFGGNPLACAVAVAALNVLEEEKLVEHSREMGDYLQNRIKKINNPKIKDIRGKGLFVGVEINGKARPYCEKLMELGVLCKETHVTTIRLAPPLVISKEELDWALERLEKVLAL